mmetsp:Transcript_18983/g.47461  ORF Transcript_18983/g.47461 Transcript_18983/m.47461 type:complete len:241 (+) Transcript_18983:2340-3062(+)
MMGGSCLDNQSEKRIKSSFVIGGSRRCNSSISWPCLTTTHFTSQLLFDATSEVGADKLSSGWSSAVPAPPSPGAPGFLEGEVPPAALPPVVPFAVLVVEPFAPAPALLPPPGPAVPSSTATAEDAVLVPTEVAATAPPPGVAGSREVAVAPDAAAASVARTLSPDFCFSSTLCFLAAGTTSSSSSSSSSLSYQAASSSTAAMICTRRGKSNSRSPRPASDTKTGPLVLAVDGSFVASCIG